MNREFEALISAQGIGYRWSARARSRCCIMRSAIDLGSVGVVAGVIAAFVVAVPLLILPIEQGLAQLLHL